jgi:hypothetical protein
MCLNETYSKVHVGELLSDKFPNQNDLKQGDAILPLIFNFALQYANRKLLENRSVWSLMGHISYWSMRMMLICLIIV